MSSDVALAGWTPLVTADGSWTLLHPTHGQACHSRAGAWQEARERYARSCELAQRTGSECSVLDVGTGLGLNLAAALEALSERAVALHAVSLESDAGVLRATLLLHASAAWNAARASLPDGLERWHAPVRRAFELALADPLAAASPAGVPLASGRLRLLVGDGRATLAQLASDVTFDAVFLDAFSPAVDPPLWESAFVQAVARRMRPGSWLSTYSASLRVRANLRAAGLRVGPLARVGAKASGTRASPDLDPGGFDARTARKLERRVRKTTTAGLDRAAPEHQPG